MATHAPQVGQPKNSKGGIIGRRGCCTCDGTLCIVFKEEARLRNPVSTDLWRVVTVFDAEICDNTNRRKYRLVAEIWARAVRQGTAFSNEVTLPCSV
jgi:hypothetical protein